VPERVDWFYYRKGCRASQVARRFLDSRGCAVAEVVDAATAAVDAQATVELIRSVRKLVVAWRGSVRWWELDGGKYYKYRGFKPGRDRRAEGFDAPGGVEVDVRLCSWILGPSGSLRTPALRKGGTLLVGFSEAAVKRVFRA
jgi:hypothetical protein